MIDGRLNFLRRGGRFQPFHHLRGVGRIVHVHVLCADVTDLIAELNAVPVALSAENRNLFAVRDAADRIKIQTGKLFHII